MAGCSNSLEALDPSCEAIRKKGGFDKTFYVGNIADLDGVTITATGEVTAFTFASGKGFKKITGKRLKHGATTSLEVGDIVNDRMQNFNSVLYAQSAAERHAIELLADAIDIFIVAESNSGSIEVFGIANDPDGKYDNYGLEASAGEWNYGVEINEGSSITMTFSGKLPNSALIYDESETTVDNLAVLDGQVV